MIIKLGMEHYELKFYTVYIAFDPELPLTYFKAISILVELVYVLIVGPDIRWAFTAESRAVNMSQNITPGVRQMTFISI